MVLLLPSLAMRGIRAYAETNLHLGMPGIAEVNQQWKAGCDDGRTLEQ